MLVYRITRPKYSNDLSGTGARLYGGRWNPEGTPLLYCSENISLALLEILVHADWSHLKGAFCVIKLVIKKPVKVKEVSLEELPSDWDRYPHMLQTQRMGERFCVAQEQLILKVPSVIVPYESNLLLNPSHKDFADLVEIVNVFNLEIDQRFK